jgi:hypothetical protein
MNQKEIQLYHDNKTRLWNCKEYIDLFASSGDVYLQYSVEQLSKMKVFDNIEII